jgi:hypothetical protein
MMIEDLLRAIEESNEAAAGKLFQDMARKAEDANQVHLFLYPVVQQVMNPPFINPHLPKMYSIYRELAPYLKKDEVPAFIQLEVTEYARRPKLEKLPRATLPESPVSFHDIEISIRKNDPKQAAVRMVCFCSQHGGTEFARRLLLLGSGYLDHSLGHSISCTAFILLEMLKRPEQDFWPALATLADYFCKGGFHTTPGLRKLTLFPLDEAIKHHLLRATSGLGIVNLHHTITLYAMERVRHLFDRGEYGHMIDAWISFMGNKKAEPATVGEPEEKPVTHYDPFYKVFAGMEAKPLVALAERMITSPKSRQDLGRFLIKALCDKYNGNYNPHYLTGLGSALWVVDRYWSQTSLARNALFQYLSFYFDSMKTGS